MKHVSEIAAAFGIVLLVLNGFIAFGVSNALGDHDNKKLAHPSLVMAVSAVDAKVQLVSLKVDLSQKANEEAHERLKKQNDQMMTLLVSINNKL